MVFKKVADPIYHLYISFILSNSIKAFPKVFDAKNDSIFSTVDKAILVES